ncbi:hypothetical protein BDZ91DRAFT_761496 [Kalaharituber pfeilii]|nr:hypothetical protein BDZ91DRAFT_761496 [Kalaharituber pfeilii]
MSEQVGRILSLPLATVLPSFSSGQIAEISSWNDITVFLPLLLLLHHLLLQSPFPASPSHSLRSWLSMLECNNARFNNAIVELDSHLSHLILPWDDHFPQVHKLGHEKDAGHGTMHALDCPTILSYQAPRAQRGQLQMKTGSSQPHENRLVSTSRKQARLNHLEELTTLSLEPGIIAANPVHVLLAVIAKLLHNPNVSAQ